MQGLVQPILKVRKPYTVLLNIPRHHVLHSLHAKKDPGMAEGTSMAACQAEPRSEADACEDACKQTDACLRACVHAGMQVRTYVRRYVGTYIHPCMHACINTYIHTYIHTYIPTYPPTYLPTYLPACLPVCIYIYIIIIIVIIIIIYIYIYIDSIFVFEDGGRLWLLLGLRACIAGAKPETSASTMRVSGSVAGVETLLRSGLKLNHDLCTHRS